ncbi:MAG: formate dehydrogenase accessory sulfurtransferase FdhD [Gammaproteobacteria bacterium]|nr:formate dehydrogenase accessory sulfurtransferase FdhD [Gammaproteobacteria bacterium]NNF48822.1 formate dehydrogenase accessory sulfurtransferase FdhD [Woeseiaceae bacterium]MBT8093816.1 formate dehydrogenase accessory sulfurtransferase FdhD [Gammaproteobacteria bacterium]MBT8105900.1 formate dehydrogenase accessory sulfurtransferase FdhD [Gammaproteobacteria bacterium]NNK25914.1 formate dehydrogenase accessory sulfurtransferase FdhD [Woeseiaceae bacterium]
MTGRTRAVDLERFRANLRETCADRVAVEEPLEIRLGFETDGERHTRTASITMRTPGDDADLATGFLFAEGIVRSRDDIAVVKPCDGDNTIRVELEDGIAVDLAPLERHFYTTSSCGVCGKASLDAIYVNGVRPFSHSTPVFDADVLVSIPDRLRNAQSTFDKTGGLHAAAAFDARGKLIVVREDVGRHNAVDKVVGALLAAGRLPAADLGLMVSGRASFELTQKALVAGMPLIAAVSAPSSLAVELAQEFNVTLVGFLRDDTFNVYAGKERIKK